MEQLLQRLRCGFALINGATLDHPIYVNVSLRSHKFEFRGFGIGLNLLITSHPAMSFQPGPECACLFVLYADRNKMLLFFHCQVYAKSNRKIYGLQLCIILSMKFMLLCIRHRRVDGEKTFAVGNFWCDSSVFMDFLSV